MSDLLSELESRASALTPSERATLALHLLRSLEPIDAGDWEAAWVAEADRRWAEFDSGRDAGSPAGDVLAKARAALKGRASASCATRRRN